MPIYVYECPTCHSRVELQRRIAEMDVPVDCEPCVIVLGPTAPLMQRIPTAASIDASAAASWRAKR